MKQSSGIIARCGKILAILIAWLNCGFLSTLRSTEILDAYYASAYIIADLGKAPGVAIPYGGLTLLGGSTDTLLIGGLANSNQGSLYTIGITRDSNNHITGFSGPATLHGNAPFIDGGLAYGPEGVLFASQFPANRISQYKPGSTTPDKVIDLAPLGVATSHSALAFVPAGFGGAGQLKIVSYIGGEFYTANLTPDGSGTFDILSITSQPLSLPGGPEGFAYAPLGSPLFSNPSMLVSEYAANKIATYEVDGNGNPILATRRDFITGLNAAEGAFVDPLSGDFLFSTFGGEDHVIAVRGFNPIPEPTSLGMLVVGLVAIAMRRRRLPI